MSSKSKWEKCFVEAGIPQRQASDYASTFSNNRMRLDMMEDLNKELLQDLGIKALGDIITILRHAKKRAVNRSPSPEKMQVQAKTPITAPKASTATKPQKIVHNAKSRPAVIKTTPSPRSTSTSVQNKPIPISTGRTSITGVKYGPQINKSSSQSSQVGMPNRTANVSSETATVPKSKSGIGKQRMKLSDRFDGFEVESKKIKIDIDKQGESTSPTVKCILPKTMGMANQSQQSSPSVKCVLPKTNSRSINIEERFRSRLTSESTHTITRPTIVTALNKTPAAVAAAAKSVQFTVQVPSNFPKEKSDQTVSSKTKPNATQTKVTVVPAKGKALNRDKQMTSIFDRLDAPPSSSVAAELLKDEPSHKNVFRRLGSKSDKPKTNNDNMKIHTDNRQGSDSVFRRLGTPSSHL